MITCNLSSQALSVPAELPKSSQSPCYPPTLLPLAVDSLLDSLQLAAFPLPLTTPPPRVPAVYLQWQGKCRNCDQFGTVVEHTVQPAPTSTAAHVQALLQGGSGSSSSSSSAGRRTTRSSNNGSSSSWSAAAAAAAAVAPPAGLSDDFADAAADPYNTIGPDYDNDFGPDSDEFDGPGPRARGLQSLAQLAQLAQSGAWVSEKQGGGAHVPRRLSDMQFEARDLRVPLYGATGEEVR
jgi:hypothetical protein